MTLLTGIIDPDTGRAKRLIADSRKLAPPLPWLVHTEADLGPLSLSLESVPQSPFATYQDATGRATFILGDILHQAETNSASCLAVQTLELGPEILARQNGYYVTGMIDEHDAIYLAADRLGLMPLYYWAEQDHFCFSTSPNSFLSHPDFSFKRDLMGIAGILLTMYATADRTTWQHVKRLPPGHLLRWRSGEGVRLINVNSLKVHDRYFGWPQSHCQNLIQNSLNEAIQRLNNLGETSILLSGGLDSRLVAGCLRWHARYKVPIVTLGDPTDYEMQCARRVASSLGWAIHPVSVDPSTYADWATVQAELEGMHTSFVEFMWWQALNTVNRLKPRLMTGFLGDAVMGATQIAYGMDNHSREYRFDTQFARSNRYGFTASEVSELLKQPGLGETVVEELRSIWNSYEGLPFQKCWQFDLQHRQRLHVGPAAWRLSFSTWPTLPYTDRDFVDIMAGMPMPVMGERRAQYEMLKHKFPKLAVLPLDHSGSDITPAVPKLFWSLKHRLSQPVQALKRSSHIERRQYVRHLDVNGSGWRTVRKLSNKYRSSSDLFNTEALDNILPREDHPLQALDPIIDSARYKTLMGLLLHCGMPIDGDPR